MDRNQSELIQRLFDDYQYYRKKTLYYEKLKTKRPYIRELKTTPQRLELFQNMIVWCKERRIEPRRWLYSLFESRKWMFAPRLDTSHLCSKKHLKSWQINDYTIFSQRNNIERNKNRFSSFDPNRDINLAVENAKRQYLLANDASSCMSKIPNETYGFHPRSTVCARCPSRNQCKILLDSMVDFDIQSLRKGHINSEIAFKQVLFRNQSYSK